MIRLCTYRQQIPENVFTEKDIPSKNIIIKPTHVSFRSEFKMCQTKQAWKSNTYLEHRNLLLSIHEIANRIFNSIKLHNLDSNQHLPLTRIHTHKYIQYIIYIFYKRKYKLQFYVFFLIFIARYSNLTSEAPTDFIISRISQRQYIKYFDHTEQVKAFSRSQMLSILFKSISQIIHY